WPIAPVLPLRVALPGVAGTAPRPALWPWPSPIRRTGRAVAARLRVAGRSRAEWSRAGKRPPAPAPPRPPRLAVGSDSRSAPLGRRGNRDARVGGVHRGGPIGD